MGNVIPWSEIHPSIRSEEPFVAVVIVDPQREICISELVPFEEQSLRSPEVAAQEMIGAVQAAEEGGAAVRGPAGRRRTAAGAKEPPAKPADHVAVPGRVSHSIRRSSRD